MSNLKYVNLVLEKTLRTLRHIVSPGKIVDNIEIDSKQQQLQSPQEWSFKDYFSPLVKLSISCI